MIVWRNRPHPLPGSPAISDQDVYRWTSVVLHEVRVERGSPPKLPRLSQWVLSPSGPVLQEVRSLPLSWTRRAPPVAGVVS